MQAYCVKCRSKKEMKDPKSITMKNGRPPLKEHAPYVALRCSELGKLKEHYV